MTSETAPASLKLFSSKLVSWWGIRCVWLRYFDVFRKNFVYGMVTTFLEPFLFLGSFGFGLGAMVPDMHVGGLTLTYRQFVLAGIAGQAVLFQSFFEAAFGSFVRMYYQKVFQAMAATPITLAEVLWGELLWDSTKATFSATMVLVVGVALGDFRMGAPLLLAIPLLFLGALAFSAIGVLAAAKSQTIDAISYPQYIIIFPMFLFCGVFFPVSNLPSYLQWASWLFPLTPFMDLLRATVLGTQWHAASPFLMGLWLVVLVPWSMRAMTARVVQ